MSNREQPDPLAIIAKLAEQEKRLAEGVFLAPVIGGGRVCVRLQGIVYEMSVDEAFEGWAVLQMTRPGKARVVEQATPALVGKYLRLFARVRLVVLDVFENRWWAIAASTSDTRFQLSGPVPLNLPGSIARFDTVYARFDGGNFWFEGIDRRRDPSVARSLRAALDGETPPPRLRCQGMVPQERLAYKMLWLKDHKEVQPEAPDDRSRVSAALRHAGASLDAFWYESARDSARVRLIVDGQTHVVSIRPSDLSVLSAGICLEGQDQNFDLTSLVGVFREYSSNMD